MTSPTISKYKITSPNDWFNKIGIKVDANGQIQMPMKFLITPLAEASSEMERYHTVEGWSEKMRIIKMIALNVRQVDNAYFGFWSKSILFTNPKSKIPKSFPCYKCFRITMSTNSLKANVLPSILELRNDVNKKIIHATENGYSFTLDFKLVGNYYNQILSLNMFHFPGIKALPIQLCKTHKTNSLNQKA